MRRRIAAAVLALVGVAILLPGPWGTVGAQGQKPAGAKKTWSGRTAWGDPDLQGKWEVVETATPMERPRELANRELLTDKEVAERIEAFKRRSAPGDPDAEVAFPENKLRCV